MSGAAADADTAPSTDDGDHHQHQQRVFRDQDRDAARRRLRRDRNLAIRAPLSTVLRDHALVHLPPAAAARLRLVHPSWARALTSPLFAVAHAATPRRSSGLFFSSSPASAEHSFFFLPLDAASDTVPSPTLSFLPTSSPPPPTVLSSTHGLACVFSAADDAYFLCNPATGSWHGVPCPPRRVTRPRPAVVVLFDAGVYNFRADYRLVCAFESAPNSGAYCFAVFASGTGSWVVAGDAVAPAEGLVPASGVAAGGTAWWRTDIGTAVGYDTGTGQVELALCPGDSATWEIGSVAGALHCAVRDGGDVVVFRRLVDGGGWEVVTTVAVAEILDQPWQPPPAYYELSDSGDDDDEEGQAQARAGAAIAVANRNRDRNRIRVLGDDDDVRLLPFQGGEVEVVVLAGGGRRVVAFETVARRRREAVLPDRPDGKDDWGRAVEFVAHTNTLALVAPVVFVEPPDDDLEQELES